MRSPSKKHAWTICLGVALGAAAGPALAGAEGEAGDETMPPTELPAFAFATGGPERTRVEHGGLVIDAERKPEGFLLSLRNPTDTAIALSHDVVCERTSGSPMSRMGPMTVVEHVERLELSVGPGERRLHLVRVPSLVQQAEAAREAAGEAGTAGTRGAEDAGPPAVAATTEAQAPRDPSFERFETWSLVFAAPGATPTPADRQATTLRPAMDAILAARRAQAGPSQRSAASARPDGR